MYRLFFFICIVVSLQTSVYAQNTEKETHGKIDFLTQVQKDLFKSKLFIWNNKVKGGIGYESIKDKSVKYVGGYYKRDFRSKLFDDIVIGGYFDNKTIPIINGTTRNEVYANYELQGDIFLENGFGIGGGHVKNNLISTEINFVKASFKNELSNKIKYTFAVQMQFIGSQRYFGGLGAIYSERLFAGGGYDGEQWRIDFGYIHPKGHKLRPAAEVLYIDNSIGNFEGSNFFFINGTLDFKGGFLSNAARLGRTLGPTGIVFTNPLGFLNPNTWNRIHNTWELGKMVDFRIIYFPKSNQNYSFESILIIYPINFDQNSNMLDNIFVGYNSKEQLDFIQHTILAGYFGKIYSFNKEKLPLLFSGSIGYDISNNSNIGTIGLILKY